MKELHISVAALQLTLEPQNPLTDLGQTKTRKGIGRRSDYWKSKGATDAPYFFAKLKPLRGPVLVRLVIQF